MAETIEMITWPKHKNILYHVTSSAFTFEVKGSGNALIGLGSNLHKKCEFIIKLENNSFTSIVVCNDTINSRRRHSTPDLFSMNEYRRFWITWYGGWLVFGREGETKPTVSIADPLTKNIKYVTFGIDRTSLHWRFDISPLYKRPEMKQISDGALRWVSAEDQIPDDAVIGGYENEILYIIRAPHRGSLTPGKFVPSLGLGFISWGGSSHEKGEFEVLCGYDCYWVPSNITKIPVDAMEAGYSEDHLERLYIGRAKYMGHFIPGKVQISHKVCYISFGDREIAVTDYDVLACPHTNPYSVNKVFVAPFGGRLVNPEIHQGYESPNAMDEGEDDDYYEVEEDNFED